MKKRVVITGLGALTAAGEGSAALWNAALEKRSGIGRVNFGGDSSWEPLGASIRDFVPEKYVAQKKSLKVMTRDIQLAVAAASLAIRDSRLEGRGYSKDRFGVIVGSGVLNHELDELAYSVKNSLDEKGSLDLKKFGSEGMSALFPLWLLKYLPNMSACHISILFDLQGPNNSITTGASAGLQAAIEASRIIQRGDADLMLAGGAESKLNPVGFADYEILGILSKETDPLKAGRTFQRDHEGGIVIGEGAGFLVLEELERAKKRGAKIYAEVLGLGSSSDDRVIAMKCALSEAGIRPEELDYLQASGIGIPRDDQAELEAIREVFNGSLKGLHVGESKPIIGFTGFAAGALDLLFSAMAVDHQTIPPSMDSNGGLSSPGWARSKHPVSKNIRYAMTNAFGFNGQSVSAVLKSSREN